MAITIKGIRVGGITLEKPNEDGGRTIQGSYDLINSNDVVMAKQSFNGYSDIKIQWSTDTTKSFQSFLTGVKKDIQSTLGFEEDSNV